ncbi:FAD binding domain-containing protein [Photobacterium lipolyticum]|uniref:Dehydrogenase n=1 Tax=Photobacterium lipolyticum TaxID=266810 RepID=A0A2T3N2E8_9GAMM|nr:FAD binding domain-containing protein [Photobacterium lipolyticum]PSW06536.1 dehydrogenase [Photobacterium lipolyticum]
MVAVYRPETLAQALDWVAVGKHTLFSGGTDLMVQHAVRSGLTPNFEQDVVFLDAIEELKQITQTEQGLSIGAECSLADIEQDPLVPDILRQGVANIAAPALRNRATMAGNICNASPAADSLPALYLLDATVVLSSLRGQREMAIADFITGPGKTQLQDDEILSHIIVPKSDLPIVFYHKVGTRAANALTKLSVAGLAKVVDGQVVDWRAAFGAVGPKVVRSRELEQLIIGQPVSMLGEPLFVGNILEQYSKIIRPIDDQRSTALYRHRTSLNLLQRWLTQVSTA